MNAVFRQVAQHLQVEFANGNVDKQHVTEILTVLACALVEEGWYVEAIDHSVQEFYDWPIITKALKVARGD